MGASLPVLVGGLAEEKSFQKRVSILYGVNTLGGAAGVLDTGFFALPSLGISGSVWVTVLLGLGVVAEALLLDRRAAPRPPMLLGATLSIAGCLSIFYQIAWTRVLIPVVCLSTYAFSVILTIFLMGIGMGGLLAATPLAPQTACRAGLAATIALTSLTVAGGLLALNHLPVMFFGMVHASGDSTWQLFLSQGVLSGAMILLPTLGRGAALPLAISG